METEPLLDSTEPPLLRNRRIAYGLSCICCLLSASFTVFSLYTNFFEQSLEYTPLQVNYISIAAEAGLYLCVPFLGYIADAHRLSYLGALCCLTHVVGYAGCAWVAYTHQSWPWMALFFSIVGVACSAGFIGSLVNCARLFTNSALLAISVPTTLYGCSSLIYAQLISSYISDGFAVGKLFLWLSVFLGLTGILAAAAPILGQSDSLVSLNLTPETRDEAESTFASLLENSNILWLLLSFVFVSGPLEMYQNNIGFLVQVQKGGPAAVRTQVALFTGFSTVIRLLVGALTDALHVEPSSMLLTVLGALFFTDLGFSQKWASLSLTSAVSGIGYGSSFTLYPLIVSKLCGIERFATYWGFFILGPAMGSLIFGVLFASNVQRTEEYASTFRICAAVSLISFVIIARLRKYFIA